MDKKTNAEIETRVPVHSVISNEVKKYAQSALNRSEVQHDTIYIYIIHIYIL